MRRLGRILETLVAAAMLAGAITSVRAEPADSPVEAEPVSSQEIARLIEQLDADKFETRERATLALQAIGQPAVPALQKARTHASAEVRYRAKFLVDLLTSGVRRREFSEFCSLPDDKLDLEHGMWLIARILDPQVKKADQTRELDRLADCVRQKLGKGIEPATAEPQKVVEAFRQALFEGEKFTGNVEDYNNPDNSSLARVLETKKGLPILLSHVTVAVARRLRAPIVGVPAAGRYIVKYDGAQAPAGFPKDDIFFTPFEAGRLLAVEERPAKVATFTSRETLQRMLRNLMTALGTREGRGEELKQVQELFDLLEAYADKPANP